MNAKRLESSPFKTTISESIFRWCLAGTLTLASVFLCSYFMTTLITPKSIERKIYNFLSVDFVRIEPNKITEPEQEDSPPPNDPEPAPPKPQISKPSFSAPQLPKLSVKTSSMNKIALELAFSPPEFKVAQPTPVKKVEPTFNEQLFPLYTPEAKYPRRAKRAGIEGWVNVSFIINIDGKVSDIKVLSAEPENVFESNTIKAIKKRRYKPQLLAGKPTARRVVQTIAFKLER